MWKTAKVAILGIDSPMLYRRKLKMNHSIKKHLRAEAIKTSTLKRRQIAVIYVALAISSIVIYWPVRNFAFVNFDDTKYVRDNPYVNSGFTHQGLAWSFDDSGGYWHPLTWISHMLDCQLFGVRPGPAHVVNLVLHTVNTLLLFTILLKMTSACWRSTFVAVAFALHPLHVESVAWIVERKNVLSGLLWMLTILAYLQYVKKRTAASYLSTLFLFTLALTAKPTVITLPFVLLLLDYWPLERFSTLSSAPSRKIFYSLITEKIPFLILSAVSVYISSTLTQRLAIAISTRAIPMSLRIENAIVSYVKYLYMLAWPSNLVPFYPYPYFNTALANYRCDIHPFISTHLYFTHSKNQTLFSRWRFVVFWHVGSYKRFGAGRFVARCR